MHSLLDAKTKQLLERTLAAIDDGDTRGPRLLDDAERLRGRVRSFIRMKLLPGEIDEAPIELACFALQLPLRQVKPPVTGRPGKPNLRDRAEQAAEMLVSLLAGKVEEPLLDRTTQLLHELPQRAPILDEARLLADAVNLDDFGVTGLILQALHSGRSGASMTQVADGWEKREQYGYWNVRLKDGFHFEPIRQLARQRLENARRAAATLLNELTEDVSK